MTDATRTRPIVVHIPDLALPPDRVDALEKKWTADLLEALSDAGAKLQLPKLPPIRIVIEIGRHQHQA